MRIYYPAIFKTTDSGVYVIHVPDIKGCITQGDSDNMDECMYMVHDAIGCMLEDVEEKNFPMPSKVSDVDISKYPAGSFVTLVCFDRSKYEADKNQIKTAREKAGLNIKQLADLLGAPYRTVQDWNNGKRVPPVWLQKLVVKEIENSCV